MRSSVCRACADIALLTAALIVPAAASAQRSSYEELQTFSAVLNLIRMHHVDSVGYSPLVRAAVQGALHALDPHSRYVRREQSEQLIALRHGELPHAGLEIDLIAAALIVTAVGPGSPAEKAGVLPFDRVIAVNDTPVVGLQPHELELRLSGKRGDQRRVKVRRGEADNALDLELSVRLDRYRWPAIERATVLSDGIGYVRLVNFQEGAADEVERAIGRLRGTGARSLILDLRQNPGGLVREGVEVSALFLPRGSVVARAYGRRPDAVTTLATSRAPRHAELPLVLLVDHGSASAAELVAGALQDHGRARLIGSRTFGKALVQSGFPLPGGDEVWLTTARLLTPNGRSIQRPYAGLGVEQYRATVGDSVPADLAGGLVPDEVLPAAARRPRDQTSAGGAVPLEEDAAVGAAVRWLKSQRQRETAYSPSRIRLPTLDGSTANR